MQMNRLYYSNMQKICSENTQKYAGLYVKYAEVYLLHILHLYALLTLLMNKIQVNPKFQVCDDFPPKNLKITWDKSRPGI